MVNLASRLWMGGNVLQRVDDFIRSKFLYTDEKIETLVSPEYMLQGLEVTGLLRGDCDDISMFHAALLTAMDIKVRFVAIRSMQDDPNYDHVFIEAWDGTKWVLFDATVPRGTDIVWFSRITANV